MFNDPHFSRTEPECRAPSYPFEMLDRFHLIADMARKLGAAVGCTGDWFHRKGRVTFHEANDLLAVLSGWQKQGIRALGILGNHDIAGHGLDSMDSRAAGAMVHSKALQLLDSDPATLEDDTGSIYVTGTSYFHGNDASDEARIRCYGAKPPKDTKALHVHLAHGAMVLESDPFFDEFTKADEKLVDLLYQAGRLPDVVTCGHLHFPEGIRYFDRPDGRGKVAFCRVGSLGQVSADDLERVPCALVMASKARAYTLKAVPVGGPVTKTAPTQKNDARDPAEHEARIKDFVRVLREQADEYSLADHGTLIRTVAEKLGHGEAIVNLVIAAVERRQ